MACVACCGGCCRRRSPGARRPECAAAGGLRGGCLVAWQAGRLCEACLSERNLKVSQLGRCVKQPKGPSSFKMRSFWLCY